MKKPFFIHFVEFKRTAKLALKADLIISKGQRDITGYSDNKSKS